ncbi:hypothetical protein SNE40_012567 [Patella caerulea]|uniref:Uncharacterized protein n=1 Tax=Patella caerulea TaxID=87958 RepID=A0AAN8PQS0_PATCE
MAKDQVLCLLLLMIVLVKSNWQEKNCFCQVVQNNESKTLIHDMGSIVRCKQFLGCSCNHIKMRSCYANCENAVKLWAKTSCPSNMIGQQIRAKYKASICHNGLTSAFIICSGNTGSSSSTGGGGAIASSGGGGGGRPRRTDIKL